MTPFLSFIVLLLTLFGFLIGLINAVRKYNNTSVTLRWVLIPLFISFAALFINLFVDNNQWNIKNLIGGLNQQRQDSLDIENFILSDTLKQTENRRKIVKKSKGEEKETQPRSDTLIAAGQESEKTNQKITGRIITSEQKKEFINYLKDEPKGSFRIQYIAGDAEAFEYSKRISDMLVQAGYHLSGELTDFVGNEAVEGISIIINRNETQPRYARAIFFAFRSIGINIVAERNKKMAKPLEVLITVGHKK